MALAFHGHRREPFLPIKRLFLPLSAHILSICLDNSSLYWVIDKKRFKKMYLGLFYSPASNNWLPANHSNVRCVWDDAKSSSSVSATFRRGIPILDRIVEAGIFTFNIHQIAYSFLLLLHLSSIFFLWKRLERIGTTTTRDYIIIPYHH